MVVKLKTPLGGTVKTVFTDGEKAPSTPVLPLLNVWAWLIDPFRINTETITAPVIIRHDFLSFISEIIFCLLPRFSIARIRIPQVMED